MSCQTCSGTGLWCNYHASSTCDCAGVDCVDCYPQARDPVVDSEPEVYGDPMSRLEVGNRVRSNEEFDPLPHEGTVQSIVIGMTGQGPLAILRVLIDRKNGVEVPPHLHESPVLHWDLMGEDGNVTSLLGASPQQPTCESCGESHGQDYFTPEMIALHLQMQGAPEHEQMGIYLELAHRFMAQVTDMDVELPDHIHKIVEKALDAEEQAERAIMKVARMVVRNLDERAKQIHGNAQMRRVFIVPLRKTETPGGGLN